jgi:class 3 adenylate cyclase
MLQTGFDLVVLAPTGSKGIPVLYGRVLLGGAGAKPVDVELAGLDNREATLTFQAGKLFLTSRPEGAPSFINDHPTRFGEVKDGDEIRLGEHRLQVRDSRLYPASLETYPHPTRRWVLLAGSNGVGRPEKRVNQVELEDPTVSRVQASIDWQDGKFVVRSESPSPTRVNGERVEENSSAALADGDIVQFGKSLYRFRRSTASAQRRELIPQEATILFSDVWNYSTLAENRPLEHMIGQMNEFYRGIGKVIEAHGGVLMTFLGDALMAVFGSSEPDPQAPVDAVRAAIAMHKRLDELNADWVSRGLPTMRIGVGINTGEVMIGHVGFTGRYEFAAMGDNTNLAARLEKLTREHNAAIIVSGSTHAGLGSPFTTRALGSVQVKGRQGEVDIFQVLI